MSNTIADMRPATKREMEVLEYLNDLRESGETNMFGARVYIIKEFPVSPEEAKRLLLLWMDNFNKEGKYDVIKDKRNK